jgi:hypothetical protein
MRIFHREGSSRGAPGPGLLPAGAVEAEELDPGMNGPNTFNQ